MKMTELEQLSGFPRTTIHYYVREGVIHAPGKTGSTTADYDETHLAELKCIERIKEEYYRKTGKARMPINVLKKLVQTEAPEAGRGLPQEEKGTRRANKADKVKLDIIQAAMRLYSEKGYYQASAREIAREAGVSPSTFYFYFRNKRELFAEMIELIIDDFKSANRAKLEQEKEVFGKALIMFQTFQQNYLQIGEVLNQLRAGAAANDPWAREKLKKIFDELTEDTSKTIQDAIKLGVIREVDPALLSYILVVLAEANFQYVSMDSGYNAEQVGFSIMDWLYNGLDPNLRHA